MLRRQLVLHGLDNPWWVAVYLGAILLAVWLIVLLFRYERRLVPRRTGNTLLILRMCVLAAVLLTFLQPVLTWTLDRERTGRVLVALDLSESMDTADNHASPAEKLRWARALGMIGNPQIDPRLDAWQQAFERGDEPVWVSPEEASDPQRRAQLERIRKDNLAGIFAEIDALPRKEIARRLLLATTTPLLSQIAEMRTVDLSVFAGKAESVNAETLSSFVQNRPDSVIGEVSDLSQALSASAAEAGGLPLIAVVVLTDGRDNAGNDTVGVAQRLGRLQVPVFPIVFGSRYKPTDLAIAELDYPQTVFKDDKPLLRAKLATPGFQGKPLDVVLEREGREPVVKTITPEGDETTVEFQLDGDLLGRREYTLRTDLQPGETRRDNNSRTFAINVVDDKVRILLVEGEARWEFRYINAALSRDDRVKFDKVVFNQPYLGVLESTFFPRRLDLPADSAALASSPFAEPDLVIVGDVSPGEFPETAWSLLEKFVGEAGGTLVLVAGKEHMPLQYHSEVVNRMLPVTDLRPIEINGPEAVASPTERGFHLQLTPDGEAEPMLQFDADRELNRDIWRSLPGHTWGLIGRAKPGATVLATAVRAAAGTLDDERTSAVIVRQHYGFGQVLWLGIDSTWRWRHLVGDRYHHRFWGQLGRWAADNKSGAGNDLVKFGPEHSDIQVGEDAVVRARFTQPALKRFPEIRAKAEVYQLHEGDPRGKPFATIDLTPAESRPLIHEGRLVSLPAGEYRLKLIAENADLGSEDISSLLFVNPRLTPELSDLSANRELLSQIADVTQGRVYYPDELGTLVEQFQNPRTTQVLRHETELWDHWFMMLVFFALLTGEWVVRKVNGLP